MSNTRRHLPIIQFVVTSVVSLVAFFVLVYQDYVRIELLKPYSSFVAECSRATLRMIGVAAAGTGTVVGSSEYSIDVLFGCNGLEVTAILLAIMLSFPATLKAKLVGVAIGYPLIFIVNIVRVDVLFLLGHTHSPLVDVVHHYYAQAIVILVTLAIWLVWATRYSRYAHKTDQALSN